MRRLSLFLLLLILIVPLAASPVWAEKKKNEKTRSVKSDKKKNRKGKATGTRKPSSSNKQKKSGKRAKATAVVTPPPEVKDFSVVTELRCWSNPDYTRIAITLDRETHFEPHLLPAGGSSGPRLYLDISGARVGPGIKDLPIADGLLKTARIAQYAAETVRVVLDLESLKDHKVFTFSDPFRIIIDVKGDRRPEISAVKEGIQAPTVIVPAVKQDKSDKPEPKGKHKAAAVPGKIRRVVVDPGHGGHDPGAVGAGGTREKDVVLQIGTHLARLLREELGLDVVMTRSTDVFLELQERTAIANQVGADLFVSVHANAALNRTAAGIETYYLNLAKTEKAAQLAALENGTSLEKVSLLQAVLFDLMANYKLNDSAHLAEEVQKALHKKVNGSFNGVKNLGVKQGPFYVLVGATMPSILVEAAFLSNEREEGRLKDPEYQERTAEGIMEGVRSYINSLK